MSRTASLLSLLVLVVGIVGNTARAEYPYPYPLPPIYPVDPRLPANPLPIPLASFAKPDFVAPHPSISPLVYAEERVLIRGLRDFVIPGYRHSSGDYIYASDPTENLSRKSMVCAIVSSELSSEVGALSRRLSRDRWYVVERAGRSGRNLYLSIEPAGKSEPGPGELKGPVGISCYTNCTPTGPKDPRTDILGCRDMPTPNELACAFDLKVKAADQDGPGVALVCPFRNSTRRP